MSIRHLLAAHVFAQSADVGAYTLTFDRVWATAAALLGLAGVIIGGLALARSRRRTGNGGRRGATMALAAGLLAAVNGALVLVTADGGPGSGNGVVGGAAALVLGLIAAILGGLLTARSRRIAARVEERGVAA
ncbi:MAG TPA: DUF6223 family protein [Actinophytocola sp.]|uniref:DUF6223 family protein n=1 Tax=Actinophytocola sp. TaxID=1872138 RepID=UPI002DDCF3FF|nr:DUF6223 family protein [Actinophytocola sp.]HEV2784524.1 DUF6223 family protein [Actinophytocola sp.]